MIKIEPFPRRSMHGRPTGDRGIAWSPPDICRWVPKGLFRSVSLMGPLFPPLAIISPFFGRVQVAKAHFEHEPLGRGRIFNDQICSVFLITAHRPIARIVPSHRPRCASGGRRKRRVRRSFRSPSFRPPCHRTATRDPSLSPHRCRGGHKAHPFIDEDTWLSLCVRARTNHRQYRCH